MTRMSKDRAIIASLLLAFAIELMLLLWHSGIFHPDTSTADGKPAGHIVKVQNQLRRRSADSLVWENSNADETVYYHDSVLTLKESQSVLALDNQTEVTLSENTLITIEPPSDEKSGEIRLRFVRGDLGARNPFLDTKIQSEEWSVDLKKGSDLEMRELSDGQIELRLKSGTADLLTKAGASSLRPEEILRLHGDKARTWLIDEKLSWSETPARRIYVHGNEAPIAVAWRGDARELLVQTLGGTESVLPLEERQNRFLGTLPIGHHRLFLREGKRTSEALDIQVWRAPLIHLLAPLPRNRVENRKPVAFIWQKAPQADSYVLNLIGSKTPRQTESKGNRVEITFAEDEDWQWFVEGIDGEGFQIPPAYHYPLYSRDNPLAAPKLRSPKLRAPAARPPTPKGAWLWSWLLPMAQAEELIEAEFGWDEVPGANQYVIEISESADFRSPIVNTTIKKETQFLWRGFKLQKYYWRVAAGHSHGRMGIFSEPESVDFTPLKTGDYAALDGILIRKIAPKATAAKPKAAENLSTPEPPPQAQPAPPQSPAPIVIPFQADRILLWQPKYSAMKMTGTEESEAKLAGPSWTSLGFEWPWFDKKGALWILKGGLTSYAFQPDPADKYPFQKDLNWIEAEAHLSRFFSAAGFGFDVRRVLSLERTEDEAIRANTALWFGVDIEKRFVLRRGQLAVRLSPLFSRDGQAVSVAPEWRARIGPRFVTGVGVESIIFLHVPDVGYRFDGYFTIGYPF